MQVTKGTWCMCEQCVQALVPPPLHKSLRVKLTQALNSMSRVQILCILVFLLLQWVPFYTDEQCVQLSCQIANLAHTHALAKGGFHNDRVKSYAKALLEVCLYFTGQT